MMIIAISLSIVAFSTMLYARSIVISQEAVGYSSTNPSSARLTLHPGVRPTQVEAMRDQALAEPGVIDATMRTSFSMQLQKTGGEAPVPLQFFTATPDDPMRIANFKVESGSWPPPKDGLLMERSALKYLNLKVGDTITVIGPDDKPIQLQITGSVHDPSLAPAYTTGGGFAYITADTMSFLGRQPLLTQLAVTIADQPGQTTPSHDRDAIVRTALSLAERLDKNNIEVEQVAVPPPYEHPHHEQSNTLLSALLAFGALSLLLSAILIATMFNGLLTQQIPQIGILKAIGAKSSRIMQLYLGMILLISIIATLLALVPGVLFGREMAQMVLAGSLNMDVTSLAIPWWNYATVIGAGIIMPLAMALPPLIRASRRTVRESLDDRGSDQQSAKSTRRYAWLGKLPGIDRITLMAFRNVFRRRARFLLSVSLLAAAGAIFISGLNVMAGMQAIPRTITDEHRWDTEIRLGAPVPAAKATDILATLPSVTKAEAWNTVSTGVQYPGEISVTRTYPDQGHGSLNLTSVPADAETINPPPIMEGRWLTPDDTNAIVLPQSIRKTMPEVKLGDALELPVNDKLTRWQVVGIVKELTAPNCPCVTVAGFERATGQKGQTNVIRLITDRHDAQTRSDIAEQAKTALGEAGIKVQATRSIDDVIESTDSHLGILIALILLIASVIGAVGLIGLGSMMSTNVVERTREFGIMNAIGAPASTVRRLVVLEGVFIAAISCVAAAIPALLLTVVMGAGLGSLFFNAPVPLEVSTSAILAWILLVGLGAAAATLVAAYRASKLTVREALAYL